MPVFIEEPIENELPSSTLEKLSDTSITTNVKTFGENTFDINISGIDLTYDEMLDIAEMIKSIVNK